MLVITLKQWDIRTQNIATLEHRTKEHRTIVHKILEQWNIGTMEH